MKRIDTAKLESLPPKQQAEYLKKLEQLAQFKKENPLWFYNHPTLAAKPPHEMQMFLHSLKDIRTRLFLGANQSGKTTWACADCCIQAVDIEVLPPHLRPFKRWAAPFKCRIFTPDLSDTMLVVQEKIRDLVPKNQLLGGSWDKAYDKNYRFLRFKNGSWFQFMSYEQEIQKLGSATLHRCYYDEEPPLKVYEECQYRLARYGGDQIFAMTPLQGLTWVYTDIWQVAGGIESPEEQKFINREKKIAAVRITIDENPYMDEEKIEDTVGDRGETNESKVRREGYFMHIAGKIYDEFKEAEHVSYNFPEKPLLGKNYHVVVGIDPGITFTAVEWAAIDEDNNIIIFDELFVQNWTIRDVCEGIQRINAFHGIEPFHYIIDEQAKERSKQTGRTDQSEFLKYGIPTIPSQRAVETGISAVKQRLRDKKLIINGNNCPNLIREFKMYRRKESSYRIQEDKGIVPIKKDDHCVDAVRYIVMSRPYAPQPIEKDERTWEEKLMDEDKKNTENYTPVSEFGGGIYL